MLNHLGTPYPHEDDVKDDRLFIIQCGIAFAVMIGLELLCVFGG